MHRPPGPAASQPCPGKDPPGRPQAGQGASGASGTPSEDRSGEGKVLTKWGGGRAGVPGRAGHTHGRGPPRSCSVQKVAACEFREADVQRWADRELKFHPADPTPQELVE